VTHTRASSASRCQPLPAAAEGGDRAVAQLVRGVEFVQHRAGAPGLVLALGRRQGAANGLVQRQAQQRLRHVLRHMAEAQAAGEADAAAVRLLAARDAAQQRRLAAAIAGDEPDPVAGPDLQGEILKQRPRRGDA
jgi:hypothetical protein